MVGINHRSAPIEVLEAVAEVDADELLRVLLDSDAVGEGMVLSTCNRVEAYASITKFHPALRQVGDAMAQLAGVSPDQLIGHLYVHYEDSAVRHAFRVASGLDSMVVGDEQILGQFRDAFRRAQEGGAAGRGLHELAQEALRVGKRVHSQTGIRRHGASVVEVALAEAGHELGGLQGRRTVIVGSGSMSSLAATVASRAGAQITVIGRTSAAVQRLADAVGGRAASLLDLDAEILDADLVVSATAAQGLILTTDHVSRIRVSDRRLVVCDLAMPHDTEPSIGGLPGVRRLDIAHIGDLPGASVARESAEQAEDLVTQEAEQFAARQTAASVEPIVAALRARADEVLKQELGRLRSRLPGISDEEYGLVAEGMRRTVNVLLHTPTVRMKEFAADPGGDRYAEALHALFDLDPEAVSLMGRAGAQVSDAVELPGA